MKGQSQNFDLSIFGNSNSGEWSYWYSENIDHAQYIQDYDNMQDGLYNTYLTK